MTSVVEIGNIALTHLGEDRIISLTDEVKAARLINERYSSVRDAVLRAHPWNFAMARASLATADPAPAWGATNSYQQPTDCLRVLAAESAARWIVEGRRIVTNSGAPLNIKYIRRVEDPNEFDALFIETLGARLAADLAHPITQETNLVQVMWDLYRQKLTEAKGTDGQESSGDDVEANWLLEGRAAGITDPFGQGVEDF